MLASPSALLAAAAALGSFSLSHTVRLEADKGKRLSKFTSSNNHRVGWDPPWKQEFPWLLETSDKSGNVVGMLCRVAMVIFQDLWEPFLEDLKRAKSISVLAYAATDVSVRDLEGVYVRMLKDGWPKNIFLAVEELHQATAVGHCEALNAVFQKVGLPVWKEKLVCFGSVGAPVMVGKRGGGFHSPPRRDTPPHKHPVPGPRTGSHGHHKWGQEDEEGKCHCMN
ncbi:hypothetical protein SKAU_G00137250 [Synaphobranchus kaupii]|uniref:Uncharacterized protein n=1 Tax=Synaphobranchus kaupii TaxID=118154 RepID=A0A9Q1J2Y4_SYNKA|nr:hypothetical protein SKAU_G00137250 [Synaphobranchus kaupii]